MYSYRKRYFYPIHVDGPNPDLAQMLLEHYGGKDGEMTQVAQYLNHQVNIDNRYLRELLGLITAEELAHLETLGAMIIKLGGDLHRLHNAQGNLWSMSYVNPFTDVERLLKANAALEKRSRLLYEKHASLTDDQGVKRLLTFLARRDGIHQKLLYRCHKVMSEDGQTDRYMEIIYDYKMSLQVLE